MQKKIISQNNTSRTISFICNNNFTISDKELCQNIVSHKLATSYLILFTERQLYLINGKSITLVLFFSVSCCFSLILRSVIHYEWQLLLVVSQILYLNLSFVSFIYNLLIIIIEFIYSCGPLWTIKIVSFLVFCSC
jgi:hypothetical protein